MTAKKKNELMRLVVEYKKDPNCWPELWICGLGYNSIEQSFFITHALNN